jgi:hypothetical protein
MVLPVMVARHLLAYVKTCESVSLLVHLEKREILSPKGALKSQHGISTGSTCPLLNLPSRTGSTVSQSVPTLRSPLPTPKDYILKESQDILPEGGGK